MSKEKMPLKSPSKKGTLLEHRLTKEQKKIWKTVKRGFKEMKMIEEGKLKTRPLQEVLDEL